MTRPNAPRVRGEVRREAARWFVELNEDPQNEQARREFDEWLRRSPEHVQAFLLVSAHWEEGGPGRAAKVEPVDELIALAQSGGEVIHLPATHPPSPISTGPANVAVPAEGIGPGVADSVDEQPSKAGVRSRLRGRLALAACILLPLIGGLAWHQFFRDVYRTGVGEQRSLTLADGSTVDLNSRTRIRVRYTARERHVDLLEGQALFHVAKNDTLPFIVQSQHTQVRAVGTQFDVYRKDGGTIVTVIEGRVAVTAWGGAKAPGGKTPDSHAETVTLPPHTVSRTGSAGDTNAGPKPPQPVDGSRESTMFLDAGEQITLGNDTGGAAAPTRLEPLSIEAATAWTHRRLIFKGTPLSEVVGEFNRYSRRPIVVADPELAAIPISGSFSTSDPTDLLRFLSEVGGYSVRETSSSIEISRKSALDD
jgi:transmembrane sensor